MNKKYFIVILAVILICLGIYFQFNKKDSNVDKPVENNEKQDNNQEYVSPSNDVEPIKIG